MLHFGVRRFITQQSNGVFLSKNFVATSSNFVMMEQENDKETKKDFRKIAKMLEQSPAQKSQKRIKQQKQADDIEKWEGRENDDITNWKKHISKSLNKDYNDYAMRKSIDSWKRRARRETFCYMRERNMLGLVKYTHRYIEELIELNGKDNQRTFEDNELVVVVLKFVMNGLTNGNGVHPMPGEQTKNPSK